MQLRSPGSPPGLQFRAIECDAPFSRITLFKKAEQGKNFHAALPEFRLEMGRRASLALVFQVHGKGKKTIFGKSGWRGARPFETLAADLTLFGHMTDCL